MKINITNMIKAGIKRSELEALLHRWRSLFNQEYLTWLSNKYDLVF